MSKTVVTKVFKKNSNGQFSSAVPIGTSSEYISVSKDGNKVMSLDTLIGDSTVFSEVPLSDKIIEIEGKTGVADASATQKGLMSSIDFKKINPQILQNNEDLNQITSIGWYRIVFNPSSNVILVSNAPEEIQSSCWMQVQQLSDYNFFQRIRTTSGIYFERQSLNGVWSNWSRLDKAMSAATSSSAGKSGFVPAPAAGQDQLFLKGDGTWALPTNTWQQNTVDNNGYVTAPTTGNSNKVWKTNANGQPGWRDEEKVSYSTMRGATASASGTSGLVPTPTSGQQNDFLRGDGTWKPLGGSLLTQTQYNNLSKKGLLNETTRIELLPPSGVNYGGFIDFHYNDPDGKKDYTSRIIEWSSGTLTMSDNIKVTGKTTTNTLTVASTAAISGAVTASSTLGVSGATTLSSTLNVGGNTTINGATTIKGTTLVPAIHDSKVFLKPILSVGTETWEVSALSSGYTTPSGSNTVGILGKYRTKNWSWKYFSVASSDKRLKENIKETNKSGLQLINKIPLYEFDWKETKTHQPLGFVADELEKIDPLLSIGGGQDQKGRPIYKSVDTFYLQGFEIKAIQELSQQNQELKKEINSLKKEIKELKKV